MFEYFNHYRILFESSTPVSSDKDELMFILSCLTGVGFQFRKGILNSEWNIELKAW